MAILTGEKGRLFQLQTKDGTYQMYADGHDVLLHTYYGKKIEAENVADLIFHADVGFSGNPPEAAGDSGRERAGERADYGFPQVQHPDQRGRVLSAAASGRAVLCMGVCGPGERACPADAGNDLGGGESAAGAYCGQGAEPKKYYRCSENGHVHSGRTWMNSGLTLGRVPGEYESVLIEWNAEPENGCLCL